MFWNQHPFFAFRRYNNCKWNVYNIKMHKFETTSCYQPEPKNIRLVVSDGALKITEINAPNCDTIHDFSVSSGKLRHFGVSSRRSLAMEISHIMKGVEFVQKQRVSCLVHCRPATSTLVHQGQISCMCLLALPLSGLHNLSLPWTSHPQGKRCPRHRAKAPGRTRTLLGILRPLVAQWPKLWIPGGKPWPCYNATLDMRKNWTYGWLSTFCE